jgi:hypothetical protein
MSVTSFVWKLRIAEILAALAACGSQDPDALLISAETPRAARHPR